MSANVIAIITAMNAALALATKAGILISQIHSGEVDPDTLDPASLYAEDWDAIVARVNAIKPA